MKNLITRLRPINLVIVALTQIFFITFVIVPFTKKNNIQFSSVNILDYGLIIFITVLTCLGGYIINDIYDQEIDKLNKPTKAIEDTKSWYYLYFALLFFSILLTTYLSIKFGLFEFLLILLLSWLSLWLYSWKLKCQPLIGNAIVSFFSGIVVAAPLGPIYYELIRFDGDVTQVLIPFSFYFLFAFLLSLVREIIKDIEDVEGDRACGCKTIAVAEGIERSKIWAIFFVIVFLLSLLSWQIRFHSDLSLLFFIILNTVVSLPVFIMIPFINSASHKVKVIDQKSHNTISIANTSAMLKSFHGISQFIKIIMLCGIMSLIFMIIF